MVIQRLFRDTLGTLDRGGDVGGAKGVGNVELDRLVGVGQSVLEVRNLYTVAGDIVADQTESSDTSLAVGLGPAGEDNDLALIKAAGDIDSVGTGNERKIIDVELAEVLAEKVVVKHGVANIKRKVRGVGELGLGIEVAEVGVGAVVDREGDAGVTDLDALEEIETLDLEDLVKGDIVLFAETFGLDLGVALDANLERLIVDEPSVKLVKGVHVLDLDMLVDFDLGVLVGVGRGKVEDGKGSLVVRVLEIHVAGKGINVGLDSAIGGNGRVNGHLVRGRGGIANFDSDNVQLGLVYLVLGDSGDSDKYSVKST